MGHDALFESLFVPASETADTVFEKQKNAPAGPSQPRSILFILPR